MKRLVGSAVRWLRSDRVDAPVIVLGLAHRTGSTLVQRLLCSVDGCFIWGEGHGAQSAILQSHETLKQWSERHGHSHREYQQWGVNSFVANISPKSHQVATAYKLLLRQLYQRDPDGIAMDRWGYKEVRQNREDADRLLQLFPNARIVVVGRQLEAIVQSLLRWEHDADTDWQPDWTLAAVRTWTSNAIGFANQTDSRILLLKYEDLVDVPELSIEAVERHLEFAPGSIDRSVLDVRVHRDGATGKSDRPEQPAMPSPTLQQLLDSNETKQAKRTYESRWPRLQPGPST